MPVTISTLFTDECYSWMWNQSDADACLYDVLPQYAVHNHCYGWIPLEKWCKYMPISYIATIYPLDYIITIMVEFLLKNGADPCLYHTLPQYTLWIHNHCHGWIPLEKQCLKYINTYIFGEITIFG